MSPGTSWFAWGYLQFFSPMWRALVRNLVSWAASRPVTVATKSCAWNCKRPFFCRRMTESLRFKFINMGTTKGQCVPKPETSLCVHHLIVYYRSGIWLLCAPIGLYNVFNSPPADWTAGVSHLFEAQATGVAQAHVTARIDNRVHGVLVADGALVQPRVGGWWEGRGLGQVDRRAWSCSFNDGRNKWGSYWLNIYKMPVQIRLDRKCRSIFFTAALRVVQAVT